MEGVSDLTRMIANDDNFLPLKAAGGFLHLVTTPPGGEDDPEAATLSRERMGEVVEALKGIRAEHRAAVVLRHMEGLSYVEIAQIMEVPEGTVKGWASRGR